MRALMLLPKCPDWGWFIPLGQVAALEGDNGSQSGMVSAHLLLQQLTQRRLGCRKSELVAQLLGLFGNNPLALGQHCAHLAQQQLKPEAWHRKPGGCAIDLAQRCREIT